MLKLINWVVATLAVLIVATACDENNVGTSILDTEASIVVDSTFTVVCSPEINNKMTPRSLTHLLGAINVKEYGTLESDFVTEFMPSSEIDTVGVGLNDIDSVRLLLKVPMGQYVGDSIVPMKVDVFKLHKSLPFPIYSDFDTKDYYYKSDLLGSRSYSMTSVNQDSILLAERNSSTGNTDTYYQIAVSMPKSIGTGLYNLYTTNPSVLRDPESFKQYFPGIYATTSYGNGRVTKISSTMMRVYYRKHGTKDNGSDTIYKRSANYLGTAPEVVTNNNIRYTPSAEIKAMADAGEPVVVSPAGYNVKIDMPVNDILNRFTKLETEGQIVLNTVTLTVPVTEIANSAGIAPPQYMLLVKASEKDKFFANSTLPDNKTSFYTEYNKTTKTYSFTGLRPYVKSVLDGEFADEDGIEDFYLIPVDATFIQSRDYLGNIKKTLTDMIPQLSTPAMAKIGKPKIVATFSKKNYSK